MTIAERLERDDDDAVPEELVYDLTRIERARSGWDREVGLACVVSFEKVGLHQYDIRSPIDIHHLQVYP